MISAAYHCGAGRAREQRADGAKSDRQQKAWMVFHFPLMRSGELRRARMLALTFPARKIKNGQLQPLSTAARQLAQLIPNFSRSALDHAHSAAPVAAGSCQRCAFQAKRLSCSRNPAKYRQRGLVGRRWRQLDVHSTFAFISVVSLRSSQALAIRLEIFVPAYCLKMPRFMA